jgi:predicted amidophosphoribosyltransferase
VFLYRGAAERIVARAKYRHDVRLLDLLGVTLGPLLDTVLECAPTAPAAVLTWIPGTPRHRRQRGGDPAATLARSAVTASIRPPTDRPSVEQLLRRHDDRPQADRDRAGRLVGPQLVSVVPAPQFVIVLDDVCTTGASLDAAGRTLRQAGAQRVVGLALAVRN